VRSQFWTAPNQLTLLRLIFIPFIVIYILDRSYGVALALLVVAGISDGLDGLLARRLKQRTRLGEYLDPVADKLLLSTLFLVLSLVGKVPWKITVLVFSRDVGILITAAVLYATTSLRNFRPTFLGKANTTAQIATVVVVLLYEVWPDPTVYLVRVTGFWITAALTVASAVQYAIVVGHRLHEAAPAENSQP
jgi:cardiolipin synthase (CMP-forming)